MKFTVTSRTSTIVAVAVGCAWWLGVSSAHSVEGGNEVRGTGSALIFATQRDYATDYGMRCEGGTEWEARSMEEGRAITLCMKEVPCPDAIGAVFKSGDEFAACMRRQHLH
jgi:hypothetical protein